MHRSTYATFWLLVTNSMPKAIMSKSLQQHVQTFHIAYHTLGKFVSLKD